MTRNTTFLRLLGKPVEVAYEVEEWDDGCDVFVTGINIGGHWFDAVEVLAPYVIDDLQAQLEPALEREASESLISMAEAA